VLLMRTVRHIYLRSGIRERLPHGLKVRIRALWIRLARRIGYPIHSPLLPPPPRPSRRTPLHVTHVLLASDINPRYLECWELAQRAWPVIGGIEPVLVVVADADDLPAELLDDERVRRFTPLAGLHTAFQAQCIRLVYPALIDAPGAVLIADMELMPLDYRYFHQPVAGLDSSFFVSYRDVHLPRGEVAIPYNAATPQTWAEVFGVDGLDDVARRLRDWGGGVDYDGTRGGRGWYTDQILLHDVLLPWGATSGRLWLLDDQFTRYHRLEREDIEVAGGLTPAIRRGILGKRYTDFNCLLPHSRFREINEEVVELGIRASGERATTGPP
jgi:hypothetical protein